MKRTLSAVLALALFGAAHAHTPKSWMTTPTPRPGDWMKRHEQFVKLAHAGGIDVLCLGDSITDGWRHMGLPSWKKHLAPLRAANFGISGDGTHNLLWRLLNGELEKVRPKVVVLLIGTNNIPWTFEGDAMATNVREVTEAVRLVIATIRTALPETKILLLAIFPRGARPNPSREAIRKVNAQLATLAGDRLTFLDVGDRFLEGDAIPAAIMPDGLHPNARGYEIWADAMMPTLRRMLAQP